MTRATSSASGNWRIMYHPLYWKLFLKKTREKMKNDTKIRCSRSLLLIGFQRKEKNEEWYKKSGVTDPGLVSHWSDIVDHLTLIAPSNQPPLPSRPQLRFPITNTNTNNKIQKTNINTNTTNAIRLKNSARCKGPPLPASQPNYSFSSRRKHIYLCARELANFTSSTWRTSFETL